MTEEQEKVAGPKVLLCSTFGDDGRESSYCVATFDEELVDALRRAVSAATNPEYRLNEAAIHLMGDPVKWYRDAEDESLEDAVFDEGTQSYPDWFEEVLDHMFGEPPGNPLEAHREIEAEWCELVVQSTWATPEATCVVAGFRFMYAHGRESTNEEYTPVMSMELIESILAPPAYEG